MRVTHVITRLIVGGAQENTVASVFGLHQKPGLEVDLISGPTAGPEGSLVSRFELNAPKAGENSRAGNFRSSKSVPKLTVMDELVRPVHPLKDLFALRRLTKLFCHTRPDIVHTHSGKAGVLGRLAAASAGVPIIVHTIHGPSFGAFQGRLANLAFRSAERYAARVTTHFVTVCDAMIEQYLAAGIGSRELYSKIFSGFDLQPFVSSKNDLQLRAGLNLKPDDIVVGKIARLFKLKGHDDLFDMAPMLVKRFPKMKFLLVGDGEWRAKFEARARDARLENHFVFAGLVPPAEMPRFVGIMDILVHLSFREGLPRALPQALAAAKPVVAYDCDGAREVCVDGQTGFLIEPGDKQILADRLLELAINPALRQRLGTAGQQFVRERFSVERMVDSLNELYQMLNRRRAATIQR